MGGGISKHRQKHSQDNIAVEHEVHPQPSLPNLESNVKRKQSVEEILPIATSIEGVNSILTQQASMTIETENSSVQEIVNNRPYREIVDVGEHIDEKESEVDEEEEFAEKSAEMFHNTAMSLEMDNEELLFNLMYFGGNSSGSFDHMVNNALEETVALHSDNNTPYKLKPASANDISDLRTNILDHELIDDECAICRDDIVIGDTYIQLEHCSHCFHDQCVMKWLTLQDWCPTCRKPIHENKASTTKNAYAHRIGTIDESYEDTQDEVGRDNFPVTNLAQSFVQASIHEALRSHGSE
jgi:hypothetical protein